MINLTRLYHKQPSGLYPRLMARGETLIRRGLEANWDEHEIWRDYYALVSEVILNPNFDIRRKFLQTLLHIKGEKH